MTTSTTVKRRPRIQAPGDSLEFRRSEICTDLSASRVFLDLAKGRARWVPELGWVVWTGRRWQVDKSNAVHEIAREVGGLFRSRASAYAAAGEDERLVKHILSFARQCEGRRGVENFLELSKHAVAESADSFDAHPLLVNCQNVTLDFEHIEGDLPTFFEHREGDMLTRIVPHDWNLGARCPRWLQFLGEIFPDAEVRDFVHRAAGYSLLGTTSEQVFFICYGTGANGKSVFLNTLLWVFGGDYGQQADPRSFMVARPDAIRNDIAALRGARFVSAIEIGDGARLDEQLVKQATGGDPVRARLLYHEAFEFLPQFKLWLAVNHRPRIRGTDHAIWRRVRLVPFTVTIAEDRRDPNLPAKLGRESEGILRWLVEGAVKYLQAGLVCPAAVRAATQEYREGEDLLGNFLADCCTQSRSAEVSKANLFGAFSRWAQERGERTWSERAFSTAIKERGFDEFRTGAMRYWVGLGLLE